MKYDSAIVELKNILPNSKSVLIAVAANADIDKMAAALALFLILEAQGKEVSIVSDDEVKVSSAHLFGIDHVQKILPKTGGGNLTLTLEGVAASDNTIPALEKLDWSAQNNNLNLVFHVLPGQTFQPARIVPHYQGSGFNVIFAIGAVNLNALGNIYQQNQSSFSGAHIANIDNQMGNTSFGATNVVDTNASSLSEIMVNLIPDLGFNIDQDAASNLLAGVFSVTNNLTNEKVSAETYMVVANCLRVGGKKPANLGQVVSGSQPASQPQSQTGQPAFDWSALMPKDSNISMSPQPVADSSENSYTMPPVVPSQPQNHIDAGDDHSNVNPMDFIQPSPEERPSQEGVVSETVEPEWLTPKIFKGSSIG